MFESYLEHLKGVREAALPFENKNEEAVSVLHSVRVLDCVYV